MPYKSYQLKITCSYDRKIYRILEIGGTGTFADMSAAILEAFEFGGSHLSMFSLSRKPYDPNGIYQPEAGGKNRADKMKLQDAGLHVKDKFLILI